MIVSQDLITQGKQRRKIGFKSITLCNKTENGSPGMWCGEKCKATLTGVATLHGVKRTLLSLLLTTMLYV